MAGTPDGVELTAYEVNIGGPAFDPEILFEHTSDQTFLGSGDR